MLYTTLSIPPSHCLNHESSIVDLQTLIPIQQQQCYRFVSVCLCMSLWRSVSQCVSVCACLSGCLCVCPHVSVPFHVCVHISVPLHVCVSVTPIMHCSIMWWSKKVCFVASAVRLYYRCVEGKTAGQKWCGNIPWAMVSPSYCYYWKSWAHTLTWKPSDHHCPVH